METSLVAQSRATERGKSGTRKVRAAGQVPAVVYGPKQDAIAVSVDPHALSEMFRKSNNRNTVVEIKLDGQVLHCLVREVQRHPLSRTIEHVDFYKVEANQAVVVEVPVNTTGKSKGLASGGRVQIVRKTLDVKCAYTAIPTSVDVDVSDLDVGDYLKVSQLTAPSGVQLVFSQDFPVVRIEGKQKDKAEEAQAAGDKKDDKKPEAKKAEAKK